MKKTWKQLALGFSPVLMGFCSSILFWLPIPLLLSSILVMILWFWLCFRCTEPDAPLLPQILRLCLPGVAVVLVVLWGELALGSMVPDLLIRASNFYFYWGLAIGGRLVTNLLHVITAWPYYLISCSLFTLGVCLTVVLKRKLA